MHGWFYAYNYIYWVMFKMLNTEFCMLHKNY